MAKSVFVLLNAILLPIGIGITAFGLSKVFDADYDNADVSHGFVFSLVWICIGIAVAIQWLIWLISHMLVYKNSFKIEHLLFNGGLLLIATTFIISGIVMMNINPISMGVCQCKPGFYGVDCVKCSCVNGICDEGVYGTGKCVCDQGYTGIKCDQCAPHYEKKGSKCVCESVWTGPNCDKPVVGYNVSLYPTVTCNKGWDQTEAVSGPHGLWPVCGACSSGFAGEPTVNCKQCLKQCNGKGTCWDNDNFKKIWEKETCTGSLTSCVKDSDCPDSFNCGGRCRSKFRGASATWYNLFDGKVCHTNADCNFGVNNIYINQTLPDGWDTEGECREKSCCKEPKYGNATCYNCKDGRKPPACDECPATDCNGKGTCLPFYKDGEYDKMGCKCQTEGNSVWRGEFCECLADSVFSSTCKTCVQGYYLPVDTNQSIDMVVTGKSKCFPCPGVVKGRGIEACNWKKGLGTCIYADNVQLDAVLNVGKCSCTTALLGFPPIAATGETCEQAPPNFYKLYSGEDWVMMSCPRTLPTNDCENPWTYLQPDGTEAQACTQSCGAKSASCENGTCICNDVDGFRFYKGTNGLCTKLNY